MWKKKLPTVYLMLFRRDQKCIQPHLRMVQSKLNIECRCLKCYINVMQLLYVLIKWNITLYLMWFSHHRCGLNKRMRCNTSNCEGWMSTHWYLWWHSGNRKWNGCPWLRRVQLMCRSKCGCGVADSRTCSYCIWQGHVQMDWWQQPIPSHQKLLWHSLQFLLLLHYKPL